MVPFLGAGHYSVCVYPDPEVYPDTEECEVPGGDGIRWGGWFMNVFGVDNITSTEAVETGAQFNTGDCAHLRFDAAESIDGEPQVSNVWVRLDKADAPRRWEVWTEADAVAVCRPDNPGNKPTTPGRRYFELPFRLWLTEVLPSP